MICSIDVNLRHFDIDIPKNLNTFKTLFRTLNVEWLVQFCASTKLIIVQRLYHVHKCKQMIKKKITKMCKLNKYMLAVHVASYSIHKKYYPQKTAW